MNLDTLRAVCRFSELPNPGARAFTAGSGAWPLKGLVVRRDARVYAYVNRCPHAGHPLNWQAHEFLSPDRKLLMCRSHGARFDIGTGLCVIGPCAGAYLQGIAVRIEHDYVMLEEDPDALAARFA